MTHRHTRQAKIGAVFSDPTGRRRKRMRRIGYFASGGCVVYMGLLGVSLTGGPISPEQLLPPGVPDKIERLLDPDSRSERRDDEPSQPLTVQDYDSRSRTPGAATLSGQPGNTSSTPGIPGTGQAPLPASPPGAETPAPAPSEPAPPEPSPPPASEAPAEPSEAPVPSLEGPTGGIGAPVPDLTPEVPSAPDVLSPQPGASG